MSTPKEVDHKEVVVFPCRFEEHLMERLRAAAKNDRRTISAYLNVLVERHVPQIKPPQQQASPSKSSWKDDDLV